MGVEVKLNWRHGDAPKNVARDLKQLGEKTKDTTTDAGKETVHAIQQGARRNVPVDTGRLYSSIKTSIDVEGPLIRGAVGSNVKYAPYVEYGTRPHKIGYGLRFKWPDAPPSERAYFKSIGSWPYVMYRTVSHPGTDPTFFLSRAVEAQRPELWNRLRRAVRVAGRRAGD